MEPEIYYRIHKSLPPVPTLSQMNLGHATPTYLFKIHFNIVVQYSNFTLLNIKCLRT
jgi:hypothetical protein